MQDACRPSQQIRILVVEDEALSRHALPGAASPGYFSAPGRNGAWALKSKVLQAPGHYYGPACRCWMASENHPALKADTGTATIPVLAITGSTDQAVREQAEHSGFDSFFTKPINLDQLLLYLRQHRLPDDCPVETDTN